MGLSFVADVNIGPLEPLSQDLSGDRWNNQKVSPRKGPQDGSNLAHAGHRFVVLKVQRDPHQGTMHRFASPDIGQSQCLCSQQ